MEKRRWRHSIPRTGDIICLIHQGIFWVWMVPDRCCPPTSRVTRHRALYLRLVGTIRRLPFHHRLPAPFCKELQHQGIVRRIASRRTCVLLTTCHSSHFFAIFQHGKLPVSVNAAAAASTNGPCRDCPATVPFMATGSPRACRQPRCGDWMCTMHESIDQAPTIQCSMVVICAGYGRCNHVRPHARFMLSCVGHDDARPFGPQTDLFPSLLPDDTVHAHTRLLPKAR
jgi:hypothetical protein